MEEGVDGVAPKPRDHRAALSGLTIELVPAMIAQLDLQSGQLVRVLPEWSGRADWMAAVYPSNRHLSVKVRSFIDHVVAGVGDLGFEATP